MDETQSQLTKPSQGFREARCGCGSLLALLLKEGIEIKCRRCKRLTVLAGAELLRFLKDQGPLSPDPTGRGDLPQAGCCALP